MISKKSLFNFISTHYFFLTSECRYAPVTSKVPCYIPSYVSVPIVLNMYSNETVGGDIIFLFFKYFPIYCHQHMSIFYSAALFYLIRFSASSACLFYL